MVCPERRSCRVPSKLNIVHASRIPTSPSQNSRFCDAHRRSLLPLLPPTSLYLLLVGGVGGGRDGGGGRKGGGRREGLSWGSLGALFGLSWGAVGVLLGLFGGVWEVYWGHLGGHRSKQGVAFIGVPPSGPETSPLGAHLGRSSGALGRSWARLGPLLGSSWGSLGPSWGHLEASEAHRKRNGEKAKIINFP